MKSSNEKNENNNNLIYEELKSFTEKISNYLDEKFKDFLDLINFLDKISSEFKEFSSIKIPKNLDIQNNDTNLTNNTFYDFHSTIFNNIKTFSDKINNEILNQLKGFKDEFENDNKSIIFSLKLIEEEISTQQNVFNKQKDEFNEEKKKNKDYKNSDKYDLYKKEINAMNKLYSNSEKKFKEIEIKFEENEMKRSNTISNSISNYFKLFQDNLLLIDNQKKDIKQLLNKYKLNQNKININEIFPESKIVNLSNWGNNLDDWEDINIIENENNNQINEKNNNVEEKSTTNTAISEYYIPQIVINNNIIGIDDEYMQLKAQDNNENGFVDILVDEEKIKDNIVINNFLYGLENMSQKNELLLKIEDIFGRNIGNKKFYIDFCDRIIKAKGENKTLYEFKIFSNLVYLTNVMNLILENIKEDLLSEKKTNDYFDSYKILDKIICIGEKSVNEDTYMCAFLCKNKIFKNKNIWINCIKNKIINLLNELCTIEYLSKNEDTVFKPAQLLNKNIQLGKLIGKIGGLISRKGKKLIESCGFNKYIDYYNKLSKEQKKNVDNNALSIYHGIIKCYIRHITNYNFNFENTTDIISEICSDLKINDDEYIVFYCYYYQDCVYTSKKYNSRNKSNIPFKIKEKINLIKSEKKTDKTIQENLIIDIKKDSNKYFIIKKLCKFLEDEDKLKLICLGKYYTKIKKYIYKSFIKKDIPLQKRLHIWKWYFKFNSTISLYNYKEILQETENDFFKKSNEKSIIQIKKDINRTYLRQRNEHNSKVIYNILVSFVYSENKINYVQGINSITGFLYDLTQNEEDTFHLLLSIFILTQFREIYEDEEFQYLKILFYTAERLIYLYLPKIFSKLKDNNIQVSFFMSAYFITLYTIMYSSLPENDISFILHIWEDFFLDGWSSFFSVWLTILKYHENEIISMENDKLINYLSNQIKDSELFRKENYKKFYELKKKYKIDEELVKNLQNEISVEAGIRKVGTSTIIEDFNADNKGIVN